MNAVNLTHAELKDELESHIKHSYLEKYIKQPVIDDDKLFILTSIINKSSYSDIKKKNYIITTMLVQIALDTHDLVTENASDESETIKKRRSLTVLAGDYYSGLYYNLLSNIDDISMVHTLAIAIKEINELKMKIYYLDFDVAHELLDSLKQLESILIIRVAESVQVTSINDFVREWLLTRRLIKERNIFQEKGTTPIIELLSKNCNNIDYFVDQTLQQQIDLIEESISQIPINFQHVTEYVKRKLNTRMKKNIIVMEEG